MTDPWLKMLGRPLGLLLAAVPVGWVVGQMLLVLFLVTLGCLAWHLFHLYRLEQWLKNKDHPLPLGAGSAGVDPLWRNVYRHFFYLRRRSAKRKRKIRRVIKQFRSAAAEVPDAVVVLTEDNAIAWCNRASEKLLGLRSPQDVGLQIASLVRHPDFIRYLAQQHYDDSLTLPAPRDDALMLSLRIVPYGKKQHLLLASDISRIHRLEQVRRDFVANVSHELRTPLTVISGYLETMHDSGEDYAQRWQQPLRRMQQQSSRMLHIIEDLLLLSRLETHADRPPERPVPVPDMLLAIAEDAIALSGERSHDIQVRADPEVWILGNEQELRAAFSNLVFNAVNHTLAGSHIAIRWVADDHGAHLQVADDGEGIAPEHLSRITERFYRISRGRKRESGGTGLGLAIVKHVMNNHRGELTIASEVGVGSTFSCDFLPDRCIARPLSKAAPMLAEAAG